MAFPALILCASSSSHSDKRGPGICCFISLSIFRTGISDNKIVGRPLGMGSQLVRAPVLEHNGILMKLSRQRQPRDCYPEDCCLKEEVPPSTYLWKGKTWRQSSSTGIILLYILQQVSKLWWLEAH